MKKNNRTLRTIIAAASIAAAALCAAGPAQAETETEASEAAAALPAAGDEIAGFTVKAVTRFDMIGADVVEFEHDKTGAQVLYLANGDTNRTFQITFRTPTENDKGTPHVFEHAVTDGSAKYPSKALFFNLIYQTYNTYMNAYTQNILTSYPVASLSEAQLLAYADYYTDSVFHPMLKEDESIFREEAWRYELEDADAELTIAGTVYSEMLGANDLTREALRNGLATLFPGAHCGYECGGLPSAIPELTWDDIRDYHDAYYHPSNSMTMLYGSFEDYAAFLELLDGCFSAYEPAGIDVSEKTYEPISAPVQETFDYPTGEGTDAENGSVICYGLICEDSDADMPRLECLTALLGDDSSALMQNLKAALPGGTFGCYVDDTCPENALFFIAEGVNTEDADTFRQTVDDSLRQIHEEGFDPEAAEAIAAACRLDVLLSSESAETGITLGENLAYYWALYGDLYWYQNYIDELENIPAWTQDGTFTDLIGTYLLENERCALVTTQPSPGLKEQQDAALAEKLADIKASMSEEEIETIVAQTAAFGAAAEGEGEEDDASEYVAALQAVTVDSLPEEMRIYDLTDETDEHGIRRIRAVADVTGLGTTMLLLDLSRLTQEELQWAKLYTDLIGELDTAEHTRAKLAAQMTRYLYNATFKISLAEDEESPNGFVPRLRTTFTALDEDMAAGFDLIGEMLLDSDVTDADRLRELVAQRKIQVKDSITEDPCNLQIYRALGADSQLCGCYAYLNYTDYYDFLSEVAAQLETDPTAVTAQLEAVRAKIFTREGLITGSCGSEETIAAAEAAADAVIGRLSEAAGAETSAEAAAAVTYHFAQPADSEGIILDLSIRFNFLGAAWSRLGREKPEGEIEAVMALVGDAYLYPYLRDTYGAYSVYWGADEEGMYICSYRDPNVAETFEVYDALPEVLGYLGEIDQETLDGYIMSSYAYYAQSRGELTGAADALLNALSHKTQEETLEKMRSLKSLTADKVAAYADLYTALVEKGLRSTAGPSSAIEANADLYDAILDPFAAEAAQ